MESAIRSLSAKISYVEFRRSEACAGVLAGASKIFSFEGARLQSGYRYSAHMTAIIYSYISQYWLLERLLLICVKTILDGRTQVPEIRFFTCELKRFVFLGPRFAPYTTLIAVSGSKLCL